MDTTMMDESSVEWRVGAVRRMEVDRRGKEWTGIRWVKGGVSKWCVGSCEVREVE